MNAERPSERDWAIRTEIYRHFVEHERAPSHEEIAATFNLESEEARQAFHRLHAAHAFFLDPGTDTIRLLNPFSNVPTPFRVEIGEKSYYANCAWDMLAIPAMLGQDALIHAHLEVAEAIIELPVRDGAPRPDRDHLINYSVPSRDWYEDLVYT